MKSNNRTTKLVSLSFILVFTINIFFMNTSTKAQPVNVEIPSIENKEILEKQFINPSNTKEKSRLYYLKDIDSKTPVIFFCHGYGGSDPNLYKNLINHIVSQGYIVVYIPYPIIPLPINKTVIEEKYTILWDGIEESVKSYGDLMDLTKIGFVGHSFGAGALPALTYKAIESNNWGTSGAFMYMLAPWYSYQITQEQLSNFPKQTKLIMEVFNDDVTNDHRMAKDIFENISIPNSEKDFINLYSSYNSNLVALASHGVPLNNDYEPDMYKALDKYGIYNLFDGLAMYSFNKDLESKKIALGNGSKNQIYMGTWADGKKYRDLQVTDFPVLTKSQSFYTYSWDNFLNTRRNESYFTDESDGFIYINKESVSTNKEWKINFNSEIDATYLDDTSINLYNSAGKPVLFNMITTDNNTSIKIIPLQPYDYGETYSLYINKGMFSSKGAYLNKSYILTFTVR